ncbi:MAG: tRNA (adenosine(37)-N6)-threonylcarbamoyltransferase complex ATPase subunit type 1 TsaE [Chlamydiae bacterium]|nr:tRNA (adenosine(37)-N6)-threonylcarbamoyltransferase complex ATPase subunit type 1 TsaE [Chlamydiota bacterium]
MSTKQFFLSNSANETILIAKSIAQSLKNKEVLALLGQIGAGKTTFCKGMISSLCDIDENSIVSPTFTYLNIYTSKIGPIYHFDLYRIKSIEHFMQMGFDEFLKKEGICLIEWAEIISSLLDEATFIQFDHINETERKISLCQKETTWAK